MDEKKRTKISKFLSLILRHQPEAIGLTLGENGWVAVDDLIRACAAHDRTFTRVELDEVVETNDKKRFAFDESGKLIRANQGHSVEVEIEFQERTPPAVLYHGTAERNVRQIFEKGLLKMNRHHVHLTADVETARKVGMRYGKPIIFEVNTTEMLNSGAKFYVSANNVWLVKNVAPQFLRLISDET